MLRPRKRLVKTQLKEDKLLTFTAKAQKYVETYWRTASLAALILVIIVVAGYFVRSSSQNTSSTAALEELKARDAFARSEFDEALTYVDVILTDYSGTAAAATALMLKGRIFQQRGDSEKAEDIFQQVVRKHGDQNYLGFGAYLALGSIYYGKKEYLEAAESYQNAALKYPNHFNAPVALIEAGECFEKLSKYNEARKVYLQVLKQYSKSRSADKARDNLAELEFLE